MSADVNDPPRHIFITGHARSGTTILMQILNSAPDVFLFAEAELYWHARSPRFAEFFNKLAQERNRLPVKGYFVPAAVSPEARGGAVLGELARYYRLSGDKVALGPNRPEQVNLFNYLTGDHLSAFHLFTFRAPDAAVRSMHTMFPAIAGTALIGLWIDTIALILCCTTTIPRSYVLPRERLNADSIANLAGILKIQPMISHLALRPEERQAEADLQWLSDAERTQLDECSKIYREIIQVWDPTSMQLQNPFTYALPSHFIAALRKAIPGRALLIDKIWAPRQVSTDPRLAAVRSILVRDRFDDADMALIEEFSGDYGNQSIGCYAKGLGLLRRGRLQPAVDSLSKALETGHSEFLVRAHRSAAYQRLNDLNNAIADAQRAVELNPTKDVQERLAALTSAQKGAEREQR